ncbi:excinuclease ABC subunit UvrC [Lactococcus sp.]|uniref:excinuclease ABC subunit UvrC n=1 Tax=Lactococcus sp. TaxID=44273 RepID=UPI0035B0EADD
MNSIIKAKLELLPESPGCYLHKDKQGTVIYVGKAKNLKNRVRSYFHGSHNTKTELLVSEIEDLEWIVVGSNIESLVLEINLIQRYKPKYNIMLKDDKYYPFIKITNEKYPRLLVVRQVKKDGASYFGPYPDVKAANEVKRLMDRIFPFRKCGLNEKKVCFYYHIHQCLCPVVNHVDPQVYKDMTEEVRQFLTGNDQKVIKSLQEKMMSASDKMQFEQAAEYRDTINAIGTLRTKQHVMNQDLKDRDVFGYYTTNGWMCVQVFFVRQGKVIQRDVNMFPIYDDPEEDFLTYLGQFYQNHNHLLPQEILIPQGIDIELAQAVVEMVAEPPLSALTEHSLAADHGTDKTKMAWRQQIFSPKMVKFSDQDIEQSIVKLDKELTAEKINKTAHKTKIIQPSRGEKKQLINMAMKNAQEQLILKFRVAERDIERSSGAVENLGRILGIPKPVRIESFDNSNIMGTSPVSAMVVFIDGKPSKKDYRKYKIKTVVGADDYASMREVMTRRYSRAIHENGPLPDLIAMDGGAGQVNIAKQVLHELGLTIPVAGMQKNDKHQTSELLFGDPLAVVDLPRQSQEFFLLTRIQDEVHRFAITFHRQVRGKNTFSSKLDGIEGLGPKRKQRLLSSFKNLKAMEDASIEQVAEVGVPCDVAKRVKEKLSKPKETDEAWESLKDQTPMQDEKTV